MGNLSASGIGLAKGAAMLRRCMRKVTYCGARGKQLVSAAHATLLAGDGMRGIDSYTLNTVAGWVLGTGLLVFGLNALAGIVYHAEAPEQPGMIVEVAEVAPAEETAGEGPDVATLLAAADPAAGESGARACQACHTFDQGGAHRVGPNLWDVVGRPIAGAEGYAYSDALQAMSGDTWTYEALDGFIHDPRGFAPGTKMAYGGMRRDEQRHQLLAYLRSLGGGQ